MKSSQSELLVDRRDDSDRCVNDGGKTDVSSLYDRVFGNTQSIYSKSIANNNDHRQIEATQDIHVTSGGVISSGWSETQFKLDGKAYDVTHRGISPEYSEQSAQGKRIVSDMESAEYQKLKSAYERVSRDFRDLPKCTIGVFQK